MTTTMDATAREAARICTEASDAERMSFPEVVTTLAGAGVERYHADLLRAEKTYYMPDGSSERLPAAATAGEPAGAFAAAGVDAAIRAIQAGRIGYRTFCERLLAAGCVGYLVSLAGRRAVYYGRTGETHVEPFPAAPAGR